jgi:hypothetical protein
VFLAHIPPAGWDPAERAPTAGNATRGQKGYSITKRVSLHAKSVQKDITPIYLGRRSVRNVPFRAPPPLKDPLAAQRSVLVFQLTLTSS